MKLKEKLANDYYQERPEGFGEPTNDFLAGFEKARLLAINLQLKYLDFDDRLMQELRALGEEEV